MSKEKRFRIEVDVLYTVKQVAEMAGVSVRTLHHYDHIDLLKPADVSGSGYRLYSQRELERLQQILFFRELGFGLRRIAEMLDRPDFNEQQALLAHRELLIEKRDRLGQLIQTIDETLKHRERNEKMRSESMFHGFDSNRVEEQIARYRDEAIQKYGKESVVQSEQRVRSLGPKEWQRLEGEISAVNLRMAELMDTHSPDSAEVQEQVERWFRILNDNFGDYSPDAFAGLGDLYVSDERFTSYYDQIRPGLAQYLRDGMKNFAARRGSE